MNTTITQNVRVENQLIWLNSKIRIKGAPFLWKDALQKGLKYVYQLFGGQEFKSEVHIQREYGLGILRYNGLKKAIPREWKEYFQEYAPQQYMPIPPHNYDQSLNMYGQSWSRKVYKFLQDDVMLIHNKYLKWETRTRY